MNISIKLFVPLLVMVGFSVYAMEDPTFSINIKNSSTERIQVSWTTSRGKELKEIINPDKSKSLFSFKALNRGSKVNIALYGEYKGWKAISTDIEKSEFLKQWYEKRTEDKGQLLVTVTKGWKPWLTLDYASTKGIEEEPLNPVLLLNFPNLAFKAELLKVLTGDDISKLSSGSQPIYDEEGTQLATAEDVYRYILGLDKNYSRTDVKNAYNRLIILWAPDKQEGKEEKAFASRGFILVQKAYKGLNEVLDEKDPEKGFVVVEPEESEEEEVTARAVVLAEE